MSYTAGARLRTTVTFVPETGSVALGTVTATATAADGTEYALTPAEDAANTFSATVDVPDTACSGPWVVRWESSAPKIVAETTFTVTASQALTP